MTRLFSLIGVVLLATPVQAQSRRPAQEQDLRAPRTGLVYILATPKSTPSSAVQKPVVEDTEALATHDRARRLRSRLKRLLRSEPLGNVRLSIAVSNAATGQQWVAHHAARRLNPASTLKLITSAVALDRLGPDYQFTTHVRVLDETAYLGGSGDPQLSLDALNRLARRLVDHSAKGIRRIVVDDQAFQGGVLPPGYDKKNTDSAYRASVGAVSLMNGTAKISVFPSREGRPPRVVQSPPGGYVIIDNKGQTVSGKGSTIRIQVKGRQKRSVAVITGRIGRQRRKRPTWGVRRIEHPPLAAGYAFRAMVEKHCQCKVDPTITLGPTPPRAQRVAHHRSAPLSELIGIMNKKSNNFIAETLLRALARDRDQAFQPVSWEDGLLRVRTWLENTLGLESGTYQYWNGSGLYDGGRFSAAQVVRLLVHMNQHSERERYRASFAIAGRDGTLKGRLMADATAGRMVGKTGTLNEVSALSGYVRTRNGQRLAFSILMNNTGGATRQMRRIQDRIVSLLIEIR